MQEPKYQVGQQVEVHTPWDGFVSGTVRELEIVYTVELTSPRGSMQKRTEDQIREPRPSVEEAWEKATMLIGQRSQAHWGYTNEEWDRETRHQCYQFLGASGIKVTDEVKRDIRRLIQVADSL